MFIDQKVIDGFSFDIVVLAVEIPEFHLRFTNSDEFSKFIFYIFMIEYFKIVNFVCGNSSIESDQKRFEERFSSFKIDIHDLHPEEEWYERAFHNPM